MPNFGSLDHLLSKVPPLARRIQFHRFSMTERIATLVEESGIDIEALADKSGLTVAELEALFQPTANPTLEVLTKLEIALGQPIVSWISESRSPRKADYGGFVQLANLLPGEKAALESSILRFCRDSEGLAWNWDVTEAIKILKQSAETQAHLLNRVTYLNCPLNSQRLEVVRSAEVPEFVYQPG